MERFFTMGVLAPLTQRCWTMASLMASVTTYILTASNNQSIQEGFFKCGSLPILYPRKKILVLARFKDCMSEWEQLRAEDNDENPPCIQNVCTTPLMTKKAACVSTHQ